MLFDSNTFHYTDKVSNPQLAPAGALDPLLVPGFAGVRVPEVVDVERAGVPRQPPLCNTAVDFTFSGVSCLVDWLELTDQNGHGPEVVFEGIAREDWVDAPRGLHGYRRQRIAGHVRWLSDGTAAMGEHYQASGKGCRELEAHGLKDWPGYFRYTRDLGLKVTRLDVAFDDVAGVLPGREVFERHLETGDVICHFEKWRVAQDRQVGDGAARAGWTLYIGSPGSDSKVRIYDKTAELIAKGELDGADWGDKPHVTRVELELHRDQAQEFALMIGEAHSVGEALARVLRGKLDFKDRGDDSNRSRWRTVGWWDRFLGGVEKARIAIAPKLRSIEQVEAWFVSQVSAISALLMRAHVGDLSWFVDAVRIGEARLKPRHLVLLPAELRYRGAAVPSG